MDLAGIGWLRGLDKILDKIGFYTVLGAIRSPRFPGWPMLALHRKASLMPSSCATVRVLVQALVLLIGIVPSFAKVENRIQWRRESTNVSNSEVSKTLFSKGILVLNPAVDINSPSTDSYVGHFYGSKWAIKPERFAESTVSSQRIGELFDQGWVNQLVFVLHLDNRNLRDAYHFIRWCLPRVLYEHCEAGNIRSRWLGRIHHRAFKDSSVFWNYISPQLSFGTLAHVVESSYRDEKSTNGSNQQPNIGKVVGRKQTREIALRAIVGTVVLCIGCLLAFCSDCWGADGWRRHDYRAVTLWGLRILCVIFLGIGLGAFFLPVYYDCRYNDDCKYKTYPFHAENYTLAALSGQNTGSIPSSHIS
jgi:hypothetical protein